MITEYLINFAVNFISASNYLGIFLLTLFESIMIPIPPEVTVVFSGFLAYSGKFNLPLVIISATLGALAGSTIAYYLGYHFKKVIGRKLIEKNGHFLFLTEEEFEKVHELFKQHGFWLITVSRFIPGLRSILSLPMGFLRVPYKKFIFYVFLGSLTSSTLLATVGYKLGDNWEKVQLYLHKFDILILVLILALVCLYISKRHRTKKRG